MHGLVHQRLKAYVVEKTGESNWDVVLDRSGIEPKLYLPVSHYPDEEVTAIVETLAAMSGHEVDAIERDFGRTLAPALLRTFRAHWREDWSFLEVLERTESIADALREKRPENDPPKVRCSTEGGRVRVTYRSHRGHPGMAHGVLEGLAREFDATVTVSRLETERVDGETRCVFELDGLELE